MKVTKQLTGNEVPPITGRRIIRIRDTLQEVKMNSELSDQVSAVRHY